MRRRSVIVIALVLVLGLAVGQRVLSQRDEASPDAAPGPPGVPQTFVLDGQEVTFAPPARPSDKAVIYAHGRGQDGKSIFQDETRAAVVRALLDGGYAVAGSDAHGNAWGDDQSVADYRTLAHDLRRRGYERLYLLAESMGGVASLRVAPAIGAKAWAGIYPVCDLRAVPQLQAEIDAVWGGTPPVSLSPVRPPADLPVMAWASPGDTLVPKAANADVCAAGHVAATTGDHGDPSNFQSAGILGFFDAHP